MLSLRNKTYSILLGVTSVFFVLASGAVWFTTDQELLTLQRVHTFEKLDLVERIINRELDNLVVKQADWARWDDTYEFIADGNIEYIDSNLNDESLKVLGLNIMAFVNNSGDLVYIKHIKSNGTSDVAPSSALGNYFRTGSELLDFSDLTSAHRGILTVDGASLLIASQPITTSDGRGSRRGTIIFARYIDAEYTRTLNELVGNNVALSPYGIASVETTLPTLSLESPSAVEISDTQAIGYRLIDNIFGNPSLLLQVAYPANLLSEGRAFVLQWVGYTFFALITYVGLMVILIDIVLLRRIENMRQVVRKISVLQSGELPEGDVDDFSYLATVMMTAIKNAHKSDSVIAGHQSELAKFKMVIDHSLDHTIITDAEGKILYSNKASEDLTGFSFEEMTGKTPALWGGQMSHDFYVHFWDTIRLKKEIFEGEVVNKRKDGKKYRAYLRVAPILDDQKRVLYFIGFERLLSPLAKA